MVKRILDIVIFPFHLLYLIISFPIKLIRIILNDKKEKPAKDNSHSINQIEFLESGQLLFPIYKIEFQKIFNSFINDRKRFIAENEELLKTYGNFKLANLKDIEVIYIFGDSKEQLLVTDWRGEENEREIEKILETKLQVKADWTNVNNLRAGIDQNKQRDGKFIIELLKTIDRDLEAISKRMIFLDLSWDAYVYTVVDRASFNKMNEKLGSFIHGTEKLKI